MYNQFYHYPVMYINSGRVDFEMEQMKYLYSYEKEAGPICWETDIDGLILDFNAGLRIEIPKGNFHVIVADDESDLVFFDGDVSEQTLISAEKYYVKWRVEVLLDNELVFSHVLDLTGQEVYFFMAGSALGDTVAVLEHISEFQRAYNCHVKYTPNESFYEICKNYYPDIEMVTEHPKEPYASYCLAVFQKPPFIIPDDSRRFYPADAARCILGLHRDAKHVIYKATEPRQIKEKYVCIAVQASGLMKRWLYPEGWNIIVKYLQAKGYRVLCIDGEDSFEKDGYIVKLPDGAENFTGRRPLMERVNLLNYADFFIGLGSGLSWLAWACDIPVVLISGFSLPLGEFDTPYRVTNQLVCHGCYNDVTVDWKTGCPYHEGTKREFECSKKIHPKQVMKAIDRLITDYSL